MTTELLSDSGHTRSDLRMLEMALRKGWAIKDEWLEGMPKVVVNIALKGNNREKLAAIKLLLQMKEQNDRPQPVTPQTTINVGVNVDAAGADERRRRTLAIAERIRNGGVLRINQSGQD